ncbi:MAG: EAL domain-containing protein [Pseudomonadota bacterium]
MAGLGYIKLAGVTEANSQIRIDRAARAASSILDHALDGQFTVIRGEEGRPQALRLAPGTQQDALAFRPLYDDLLKEIGATNQGAANLFRLNATAATFDRFATTFRKPDGSMPPPMSISQGHPAWTNLMSNQPHMGEVPVMGRMRLAYLTPIQSPSGNVAGALAVDVGWADDLTIARDELRSTILVASGLLLIIALGLGLSIVSSALAPLRKLATFANDVAAGKNDDAVPYTDKKDEIGALAQGLSRVVDLQTELRILAYKDALTGLDNRARYLADLANVTGESLAGGRNWVLIHIDLDNFKDTNDAYGQKAGDALLQRVGAVIKDAVGTDAKVARLTGDSFTVLMPKVGNANTVAATCKQMLDKLAKPFALPQGEVLVSASMGLVSLPKDAKSADEAHRNAGIAVRKAKEQGRGRFVFFAEEMNEAVQKQIVIERMLREAIDNGEIALFYQPQINPFTHELMGVEALARWHHEELGMISPTEFIPVAESTGLIIELGTHIIETACRQARAWLNEGFDFNHVSVNVSPAQLWQPNFTNLVKQKLEKYGLEGHHLCVEVTEGIFVDYSNEKISQVLANLRQLGVILALDDFGSGYSSLGCLNQLPIEQLKIDRAFVADVHRDPRKQSLLRGIVALGQSLKLAIVVEGVETREELMMVKLVGCNSIQGFFYSRPVPAQDLIARVAEIAKETVETVREKAS